MRKRLIPLIALLMILAIVAVAYSVAITLPSGEPPDLGATDYVDVVCPTLKDGACQIDRIKWKISISSPPGPRNVTGVEIGLELLGVQTDMMYSLNYTTAQDKYVGGGSATNTKLIL